MPRKTNKQDNSSSPEFMLEEYKMLRERYHSVRNEGINRVNLLFTVTSAVLGGILLFDSKNSSFSPGFFQLVLIVLLAILAFVAHDIFLFMIARDRVSDRVERGMARVRRYFVERDHQLQDFLTYPTSDHPTHSLSRPGTGLRRSVQIIESFVVTLILCVVANLFRLPFEMVVLIGGIGFIAIFTMLHYTSRRILQKEMKSVERFMKFPPAGDKS